jgi:hypothetical protein
MEFPVLVESWFEVFVDPPKERRKDYERSDEQSQESQAQCPEGKSVNTDEDDWEGFEPDVQHAIYEGDVHVQEEANRLEIEGERANEDHHDDFMAAQAFSFNLGLTFKLVLINASDLSKTTCASEQDVG